jgi:transcriptional regulator with XRE-family HTH domain
MATTERELDAAQETVDWGHDALGLTYEEIGATLGVSERTLRRWRNGLNLPRRSQREKLEDLRELRYLLAEVFPQPADRDEWLHSSSRLLRGRTPISFLRQGRVAAVRDALATLETGAFL